jgi:hypothetical protein
VDRLKVSIDVDDPVQGHYLLPKEILILSSRNLDVLARFGEREWLGSSHRPVHLSSLDELLQGMVNRLICLRLDMEGVRGKIEGWLQGSLPFVFNTK